MAQAMATTAGKSNAEKGQQQQDSSRTIILTL